MDDKAIAAPAAIGGRAIWKAGYNTPAAIGIAGQCKTT